MKPPKAASPKQDEIINVASRLFSQKGYSATSLVEIADNVGLHKTSLFHYFGNKEEILMAIMDKSLKDHMNILNEIVNAPDLSGMEKLRLALEKQVLVTCKYKEHINVYLSEIKSLSPANRKKYNKKRKQYEMYFEKIIQEAQAEENSHLFKGLSSKVVNLGILGMCNWIIKWYQENGDLTPREIYQTFYSIMTNISLKDLNKIK